MPQWSHRPRRRNALQSPRVSTLNFPSFRCIRTDRLGGVNTKHLDDGHACHEGWLLECSHTSLCNKSQFHPTHPSMIYCNSGKTTKTNSLVFERRYLT